MSYFVRMMSLSFILVIFNHASDDYRPLSAREQQEKISCCGKVGRVITNTLRRPGLMYGSLGACVATGITHFSEEIISPKDNQTCSDTAVGLMYLTCGVFVVSLGARATNSILECIRKRRQNLAQGVPLPASTYTAPTIVVHVHNQAQRSEDSSLYK